ncbi:hypothetical protein [Luteolibacter soli]|uniref:Uncharacterized protein n=1 Tax=Luteolibacter soli TaxID=3135280 RepID=A0ABU9ATA4_9BACT
MSPQDENSPLAAVLAEELAGMPEEDRVRTERILGLVFETIAGLELRVRELEEKGRLDASDI